MIDVRTDNRGLRRVRAPWQDGTHLVNQIAQLLQQGSELHRVGRFGEAERCYRRVLELDIRNADAWNLLGMIAERAGRFDAAVDCIRHAIELQPNNPSYLNNLGTIFEGEVHYDNAIACFREAIRIRPNYATAYCNLGEVYKAKGDVHQAIDCYREALAFDPYFFACRSNLLMVLNYNPEITPAMIFEEHCRWGTLKRLVSPPPITGHRNRRDPDRRLRIGYVSPDLRKHAVARFFEPVLRHHDRSQFSVHLYAEIPGMDAVSERFKSLAQGWQQTVMLSTDQAAQQVMNDEIDILVDLAGHTRHNRLDIFVRRPAPVQVTYLGYSNTSGIDTIDYRVSDATLDPPEERLPMTEQVLRIDGSFACFEPPDNSPPVSPLPMRSRGYITFGSHHPTIKLNDHVLKLWRRVLEAIPTARLLFFRNQFRDDVAREFRERLATLGYPLDRVDIRCPTDKEDSYLKLFDEIDVVFDTFPFNSHTMTCEALWMGVPLVTLYGDRPTSRLSTSVLRQLQLPELTADTLDGYVAACRQIASNVDRLAELRRTMRERMRERLCDGATFTRQLEALYRQMWRRWCGGGGGGR
ncbi:MAG: tetratricopeptide repeat protein [Planctomycetaceae bacterium]|nr:tetratricopeptide repeat protein [Planctomycetaceae bacterium]